MISNDVLWKTLFWFELQATQDLGPFLTAFKVDGKRPWRNIFGESEACEGRATSKASTRGLTRYKVDAVMFLENGYIPTFAFISAKCELLLWMRT
jgi:hypothetical protein